MKARTAIKIGLGLGAAIWVARRLANHKLTEALGAVLKDVQATCGRYTPWYSTNRWTTLGQEQALQRDERRTAAVRARYDRIAAIYDFIERPMERGSFSRWRKRLWAEVNGPRILEVGVGTGKNFAYYPKDAEITAVDFSPRMLERARRRAKQEGVQVDLRLMDVQHLEFPDKTFDSVVGSFVFCSVPDPIKGLQELRRVTKPEGKIVLLEHMRPPGLAGKLADVLNPFVVRLWGANMNRRTVENVVQAGLTIERVESLWRDVVKLIVACPSKE